MKLNIFKCLALGSVFLAVSNIRAVEDATSASTNNSPTAAYANSKLTAGDKVMFSIAEDPDSTSSSAAILCDAACNLHFPVSQGFKEEIVINAKDKTYAQVRDELKKRLDATYYKNATVTVEPGPAKIEAGQIVITGPVRNNFVPVLPGERKMLLETILQAGPSEFANKKKVKIMRINKMTGKVDEQIIDVDAIEKNPTKDIQVFPGDRINLKEKNIMWQ